MALPMIPFYGGCGNMYAHGWRCDAGLTALLRSNLLIIIQNVMKKIKKMLLKMLFLKLKIRKVLASGDQNVLAFT